VGYIQNGYIKFSRIKCKGTVGSKGLIKQKLPHKHQKVKLLPKIQTKM